MNAVERIAKILVEAGFKKLPKPFNVSLLPFEFTASFVGNDKALDLVLVVDLFVDKDETGLLQKLQSLGKALDLAESRRSMTAVLIGPALEPHVFESITRLCRVLPVGVPPADESADQFLRDWLAVLLPLPALDVSNGISDWRTEIAAHAGDNGKSPFFKLVVDASQRGASAVQESFVGRMQKEATRVLEGPPK